MIRSSTRVVTVIMESENGRNYAKTEKMENLSVPPGFKSLSSFTLKRVEETDKFTNFLTTSKREPICVDTISEMHDSDTAAYKQILKHRPWILFNQRNQDPEKSDTEHLPTDLPLNACRPKGVTHGCPDCSDCLKVTARWCPEDARRDVLKEAPIFHPTEEEFKDTLKYIASIRSIAEPYGICRIIPPSTWQPPCLLEKENIWENTKFVSQIQRIDGLQVHCAREITASSSEDTKTKTRRGVRVALDSQPGNRGTCNTNHHGVKDFESKPGPTFSLKTFKKLADDFKAMYFNCKDKVMGSDNKWEPSVENVEGEYGRIVQNPTDEVEVFCGKNLEAGNFSSGFPTIYDPLETSNYPEYMKSGWNLNNILTQSDSLLSFESSEVLRKFGPRIHVGMCFSSFNWKVEEHQFYSLCYMHLGEPKVWYSVPGGCAVDFETVRKEYLPVLVAEQTDLHDNLGMQLSSAILKSVGIPVYRCLQYPREFVLVFSGAYHSGFDCGFNCSAAVSFAPLEWLLHGQNVVELYCEQRRKTSISYDKLLLGAARKAVRAQWEIELCRKSTPDNLTWKDVCGRNGILAKAFDSRIKSESLKREFLCTSLKSRRMQKDFDATCKRECSVCLRDLHLSAVGCPCSADKFACLNHAKQLCSCTWSNKIFLYRYEISELNVLCLALEGKLSAIHKWAKEDLGLTLHSAASKRLKQTPGNVINSTFCPEDSKRKESKSQNADTHGGFDKTWTAGNKAEASASLLNAVKRKRNAVGSQVTGTSSGLEGRLKARLDELKAEQKTGGQQSAKTCINRGISSASTMKPGTRAHAGQSTIPKMVEDDPKVSTSATLGGYMSFLSENNLAFEVSSESTSSSSSSESNDTK